MLCCGKCCNVINLADGRISFSVALAVPKDWLPRCDAADSCAVCPRFSPLPRECAPQLWPALQGVILGCDLFNYNPHHCTVTCSGGCNPGYQCNQDIGTFPKDRPPPPIFHPPPPPPQAPNFPSFQSALGTLRVCYTSWGRGNSQMPAEMEENLCL